MENGFPDFNQLLAEGNIHDLLLSNQLVTFYKAKINETLGPFLVQNIQELLNYVNGQKRIELKLPEPSEDETDLQKLERIEDQKMHEDSLRLREQNSFQILTEDNGEVRRYLLEHFEYLEQLFSFKDENNVPYCCTILSSIFRSQHKSLMAFLTQHPESLKYLFAFVEDTAVSALLLTFTSTHNFSTNDSNAWMDFLLEIKFLPLLLDQITKHPTTSTILDVLHDLSEGLCIPGIPESQPSPLLTLVQSPSTSVAFMNAIFKNFSTFPSSFSSPYDPSQPEIEQDFPLPELYPDTGVYMLNVVTGILSWCNIPLTEYQALSNLEDVTEPLKAFIPFIPVFTKFLAHENNKLEDPTSPEAVKQIATTAGLVTPFGFTRYSFVRFLAVILNCKINIVFDILDKTAILPTLISWIFKFPWNNILHVSVFQMFDLIWNAPDRFCLSLKKIWLQKSLILEPMIKIFSVPRGEKVGYISFLTKFGRELEKLIKEEGGSSDRQELKRIMMEENSDWITWSNNNLEWKLMKKREDTVIGGLDRRGAGGMMDESREEEDSEEEEEDSEDEDSDTTSTDEESEEEEKKNGVVWSISEEVVDWMKEVENAVEAGPSSAFGNKRKGLDGDVRTEDFDLEELRVGLARFDVYAQEIKDAMSLNNAEP
eukprot:TRINITY_DN2464_c0_g1_i2.p1 TRINITY_DN2464_c0_g1~~TRINITY_DN2464_c0_g1_i2.p1  ORF type:complete len:654 (+),score=167.36 TRINITY_DN2464_c0_g1_i2:44-2005(+)